MPQVQITKKADKALQQLSLSKRRAIIQAISSLNSTPFPQGYQKLHGIEHAYRVRVGEYRILYAFDPVAKTVIVYRIAHRKEVYKP